MVEAEEVGGEILSKYTFSYMRRFALGVLRLRPVDFGAMLLGEMLDAIAGYNEQLYEEYRLRANLVRTATTYLVNVQLREADRYGSPSDLWKMPWDIEEREPATVISKEEYDDRIKKSEDFFNKALHGNSNQ